MTQEGYAEMLSQAKNQFKSGTALFGKDGTFHRVLEDFLNAAIEGEMESHLNATKPLAGALVPLSSIFHSPLDVPTLPARVLLGSNFITSTVSDTYFIFFFSSFSIILKINSFTSDYLFSPLLIK